MASPPLPLRAHMVLCLQGFRGRGYSPAFVARMAEIQEMLRDDPARPVRLLASPDSLCEVCPHHRGGCTLAGPHHEAHMRAQDVAVLVRLGLEPGGVRPWREILDRVRRSVSPEHLPTLCTTCPWLPLGWCAEGLTSLREPAEGS